MVSKQLDEVIQSLMRFLSVRMLTDSSLGFGGKLISTLFKMSPCVTVRNSNVLLKRCVSGMDMINGAIDSLMSSAGKEDWTPVLLNVADATITVIKEKVMLTVNSFEHFYIFIIKT